MTYRVADLGVPAHGDLWLNLRLARRPGDGAPLLLGSLSLGGFVLVDLPGGTSRQVLPPPGAAQAGWAIGQAPDGTIYQAGVVSRRPAQLWCWRGQGERSELVGDLPGSTCFTLDVAPDGRVYLPDYQSGALHRYDPASGQVTEVLRVPWPDHHPRIVACAADGWVYLTLAVGGTTKLLAWRPGLAAPLLLPPPSAGGQPVLLKDALGRVLTRAGAGTPWQELRAGQPQPLTTPAALVEFAYRNSALTTSTQTGPFVWPDGGRLLRLENDVATWQPATGAARIVRLARQPQPLRIFSLAAGGGRLWGGTFIPLSLFSYDPASGHATDHGNPTPSTGEIYAMIWSGERLFLASYTDAVLTCFDPARPWQPDDPAAPNPRQLGRLKPEGLPLQRPHGCAHGPDGSVYFAAHGGYGCLDSGLCRICPRALRVERWIFPHTTFGALCYLPGRDALLVSERRLDETTLRATLYAAADGRELASHVLAEDGGQIVSWLPAPDGTTAYGLHAWRATLVHYDPATGQTLARCPELPFGDHCHNALLDGPDGRLWGLTNRCVYAVSRDLRETAVVADYPDHAGGNFYRFGFVRGPDGHYYFPNGPHLMRLELASQS
jgi:streptogramin lyase